ncbi:MAG: protease SohB [Cellvibrionaceae bacterium]|nr:protease SohB [Cellvibrionaceae bacterium]
MEFLIEYGLFLAKAVTVVIAIAVIVAIAVSSGLKNQGKEKGFIEVTNLSEKYDEVTQAIKSSLLDEKAVKAEQKEKKKQQKQAQKAEKKNRKTKTEDSQQKPRVFVVDFDGDIKASATEELREVVSAILGFATREDEVVLRLESQGGMVHSYGLAASQLARVTEKEIPLTVCVDKVAASGGYMMACVAKKIVSAPFAIIGSIGVVAQLPNFHRLLKKHDIDYEMLTAGEYKRTLTMFGENTEKGRDKFTEDLEDTHTLFKDFIGEHRPQVDLPAVATGEIWFGRRAIENKLVDQLQTSDQYLLDLREKADIFLVSYEQKKSLAEKVGLNVQAGIERGFMSVLQKMNNKIFS